MNMDVVFRIECRPYKVSVMNGEYQEVEGGEFLIELCEADARELYEMLRGRFGEEVER